MRIVFDKIGILLCLLALLTSCGYKYGQGTLSSRYDSITIPYVKGDLDGSLTNALIKQVSIYGGLKYKREGGDLLLNVILLDFNDENIGFRYDRKNDGKMTHSVIPTETRFSVLAEVTLIDTATGMRILGPTQIVAYTDFDHDYLTCRNGVNIFSLGQLSDYDEAHDAAHTPLNHVLAQKVIDYVCDSW